MAGGFNRNQALSTSFKMVIPGLEEFNYFVQQVDLPGMQMPGVETPYQNHSISMPSNRINYDEINLNFIVDEDYKNYDQIRLWMHSICVTEPVQSLMKDVTLNVVNSNKNHILGVKFVAGYPTGLSSIPLDSSTSEPTPVMCNMTFRFQFFDFVRTP